MTDVTEHGLSAVYTFFDPEPRAGWVPSQSSNRSSGRAARLPHAYLGYWIRGHQKMDYKRRFHPLEAYDGRRWHDFDNELDGR